MNLSTDSSSTTGTILQSEATAAAHAALPLLPVAAPAAVEPAEPGEVPGSHVGVAASFSGAERGQVLVLLDAEQARGLTNGSNGDIAEALRPALEAAAQSLGPCTIAAGSTGSAQALLDAVVVGGTDTGLVAVRGAGQPPLYVLLSRTARASVPGQRGGAGTPAPATTSTRGMDVLRGVQLEVTAEIGRTRMTVQELLSLTAGAVIELDRPVGSPADVLVNGKLFARGEVVVVDEDFAIRITEVVDPENGLA